jgi:hypothetical protein
VAADIVQHWEKRREVLAGKALIVCMSRRICIDLYDAIVRLRPDWHSDDDAAGKIKVVITASADEGPEYARHARNKQARREMKERAKDPTDELELVIVRDMWLTGFDSPSMHTMYVDKPMKGAGLMQAIARVNRTFQDKPSGLVVDYIGIAESLKTALADYTDRDRERQEVGAAAEQALALLEEKHEILCDLLYGCPWREALESGSDEHALKRSWRSWSTFSVLPISTSPTASSNTLVSPARPSQSPLCSPKRSSSVTTWLSSRPLLLSCAGAGQVSRVEATRTWSWRPPSARWSPML